LISVKSPPSSSSFAFPPQLRGTKGEFLPSFYSATNELDEKNYVLDKIKNYPLSHKNIAIIVRSNKEVEAWSSFLQDNSIEVESKLKTNILKSDYIIFLLKYLEIIDNPYANEESFVDTLRCQFVDVDKIDILSINRYLYNINYTRKEKVRFFDVHKALEKFE
jgi:ATP-dependent exoDNAse (exonuclease V) beta subunit